MTTKEKWYTTGILAVLGVGVLAVIHYLPLWSTVIATVSAAVGGLAGWYLKKIKDEYLVRDAEAMFDVIKNLEAENKALDKHITNANNFISKLIADSVETTDKVTTKKKVTKKAIKKAAK